MVGDYPPLLQDLNYVRDGFVRSVSHPMLVFLPDGALSRLARFAPDFWAWRMSVFRFQTAPTTSEEAIAQTLNSEKLRESLLLPERQTKIDLLLRLLTDYTSGDLPKTQDNQQTQLEISLELGRVYFSLGEMQKSEDLLQQALALAKTDIAFDPQRKGALYMLGQLRALQGQMDEAIQLYQLCLELNDRLDDKQGKAATLHCMAIIYDDQGQVDEAIALYQQVLEIDEAIDDAQGKAATLHCMAIICNNQGQVEEAIALYQQSLEIKEAIGNVQGKAVTLWWLGKLAAQRGEVEEGIAYLQEAVAIYDRLKSPHAAGVRRSLEQVQGMVAADGERM